MQSAAQLTLDSARNDFEAAATMAIPATPFHSAAWFEAAGIVPIVLSAGDGENSAEVFAWEVLGRTHYFHSPRELLTGHYEQAFIEGVPGRSQIRDLLDTRALATVTPYGYRGGPSSASRCAPETYRSLAGKLLDHADRLGISLIISHYLYSDEDREWLRALVEMGGVPLVMGAHCRMDLPWASMDEYFGWLGSHRRSARSSKAWGVDNGDLVWNTREARGVDQEEDGCVELLVRLSSRYEPIPPTLTEGVAQGTVFPRILMSTRVQNQTVRSALAVLKAGRVLYPKFFATTAPKTDYIPLVFNRLTEFGLRNGYQSINYGGGAHKAKLLRGARLVLGWGVIISLDPAVRKQITPWALRLGEAKLRYFRSMATLWQNDHEPPPNISWFEKPLANGM